MRVCTHLLSLLLVVALLRRAVSVSLGEFYDFGASNGDASLARSSNASSSAVTLQVPFKYFGRQHLSVFVNTNGVLSLSADLVSSDHRDFFPSTTESIIAPFWSHIDTRATGTVFYREETVNNALFRKAVSQIRAGGFDPDQVEDFTPTSLFIATWDHVGFDETQTALTNTFQCVLASNGSSSFILLLYAEGLMQWAGQTPGSNTALVAFTAGDTARSLVLPTSNTDQVLDIAASGSGRTTGLWAFRVDTDIVLPTAIVGFQRSEYSVLERLGMLTVCASLLGPAPRHLDNRILLGLSQRPGTATHVVDYSLPFDTLSFPLSLLTGSTEQAVVRCVRVFVTSHDSVLESDETYQLVLANSDVILLPRTTTVTILDDDNVTVSYAEPSYTVLENSTLSVCLTTSVPIERPVEVSYSTLPGTALAGADFVSSSGQLVFASGQNTACQDFATVNDNLYEVDKMFSIGITSQDPTVIVAERFMDVTLRDDDGPSVRLGLFSERYQVEEGGSVEVCVHITEGLLAQDVTVTLRSVSRQRSLAKEPQEGFVASDRSDYNEINFDIDFSRANPYQPRCLVIAVVEDTLFEGREFFELELAGPVANQVNTSPQRTIITIEDNDHVEVTLMSANYSVSEGETLHVCAQLLTDIAIERSLVLPVSHQPGSSGGAYHFSRNPTGDYVFNQASNHITIRPQSNTGCNSVLIRDDFFLEDLHETFSLSISHSDQAVTVLRSQTIVDLLDNDAVTIRFQRDEDISVDEDVSDDTEICLTLLGDSYIPVTVKLYTTPEDSATDHVDFDSTTVNVTFDPQGPRVECSLTSLSVLDDPVVEGNEVFEMLLESYNGSRVVVTNSRNVVESRRLIIQDNDFVTVNFAPREYSVSEADGHVEVCASITGFSELPLSVNITTRPNSALANIDFLPQTVSFSFPPTDRQLLLELLALEPADRITAPLPVSRPVCVNVTLIDDDVLEAEESKILNLFFEDESPFVMIGQDSEASVVITDDEVLTMVLEQSEYSVSEGEGVASVCAVLTGGRADFPIQARLQVAEQTATAGVDFQFPQSGTISFPPGSTDPACVPFTITDDDSLELPEDFMVLLSAQLSHVRLLVGNPIARVVILDNDRVQVSVREAEYSVVESHDVVAVCVDLAGSLERSVSLTLSTTTAMAEVTDFISITNASLLFEPSSPASECVEIDITDDSTLENTESFEVVLATTDVGVELTRDRAVVYILDDDGVRMSLNDRDFSVAEDGGSVEVCVELTGSIEQSLDIQLYTMEALPEPSTAAQVNTDYGNFSALVIFQPSPELVQQQCFNISITDDTIFEQDESFSVAIAATNLAVSLHISRATVTIGDDDHVTVGLQGSEFTANEGSGTLDVCCDLIGQLERSVSVSLETMPQTALDALDYATATNPSALTFTPSTAAMQTQCLTISIIDDSILEPVQTFGIGMETATERGVVLATTSARVSILDNDDVIVGFNETEVRVQEEGKGHVTSCVVLSGVTERGVAVRVSTLPSTADADDFVAVDTELTFAPQEEGVATQCISVAIVNDKLVETDESFQVQLVTSDPAVMLEPSVAIFTITDVDVVCKGEAQRTSRGKFTWPDTYPDETALVDCQGGKAERPCDVRGHWGRSFVFNCEADPRVIFDFLDEFGFSRHNLAELLYAVEQVLNGNGGTEYERYMAIIADVFRELAQRIADEELLLDTETFSYVIRIVDKIQPWPAEAVQNHSSSILQSLEVINGGLLKAGNFTSYPYEGEAVAFLAEKSVGALSNGRRVTFGRADRGDIEITSQDASKDLDEFDGSKLASILLPASLEDELSSNGVVGVYFKVYETPVMFPISGAGEFADRQEETGGNLAVSHVISATVGGEEVRDLKEPISFTIKLASDNFTNVTCVFWDFDAVGGAGDWSDKGCVKESEEGDTVTCLCDHLTNFACLVDIRLRTGGVIDEEAEFALEIISIIGVSLSLIGLALTILTFLVFGKLRKRDSTKFRVQLCISMFLMMLVFVVGIERVEVYGVCVAISAFIHYFTLVTLMWMAAEALLMFQKLIIVFTQITTRYLVIVSLFCWLLPIPAVVIPIGIDRDFGVHDNFCFISHSIVFFAAFLGPILAIIIFNLIVFILVLVVIVRHSTRKFKRTEKSKRRKGAIRTMLSLFGVMILFGLTWLFGAFTVRGAGTAFSFLFVIFNSFQGLFIFLFFVVFAKETQKLWLTACGCRKKKGHGSTSNTNSTALGATHHSMVVKSHQPIKIGARSTIDPNLVHLKELEELNDEQRKRMNSWDVMYLMPQNQWNVIMFPEQQLPTVQDQIEVEETKAQSTDSGFCADKKTATPSLACDQRETYGHTLQPSDLYTDSSVSQSESSSPNRSSRSSPALPQESVDLESAES